MTNSTRVLISMLGDYHNDKGTRTKHEFLFQFLEEEVEIIAIHNADLKGKQRFWYMFQSIHPILSEWKTRYYLNVNAFKRRSIVEQQYIAEIAHNVDVILQIGTLFSLANSSIPVVLYLDYTAALSIDKQKSGQAFRIPTQAERWVSLEREVYQKAAHICVRSQNVRDSLVDSYQVSPDKITIVGGGVNFNPLPDIASRNEKKPMDPCQILFIGKDFNRKGGDLLLAAFEKVSVKHPEASLTMITNLPSGVKIPKGVSVQSPTWDRNKIAEVYANSDIFVLPSRLETWGDVLLEAMSFGLPCVGMKMDAMEEIIQHQETGLIVPPNDVDKLANAMIYLLDNPAVRRQYGLNGRNRIENKFNWEFTAIQIANILNHNRRS